MCKGADRKKEKCKRPSRFFADLVFSYVDISALLSFL